MAKYSGQIGFATCIEDPAGSGIWKNDVVEKLYRGDILNTTVRNQQGKEINDDVKLTNRFSIVADPFAIFHSNEIVYAEYMGVKWTVSSIEIQRPRLILTIGGAYNGE